MVGFRSNTRACRERASEPPQRLWAWVQLVGVNHAGLIDINIELGFSLGDVMLGLWQRHTGKLCK